MRTGTPPAAAPANSESEARGRGPRVDDEGFSQVEAGRRANSLAAAQRGVGRPAVGGEPTWAERLRGDGGGDATACGEEATVAASGAVRRGQDATVGTGTVRGQRDEEDIDRPTNMDGGDDGEDDGVAPLRTAAELRRDWNAAAETVRFLEKRGGPSVPQAVLEGARRHRDDAERVWRAVKQPHPIGKRLRWAAIALEEAMAKEEAHRAELEDFEHEMERRRNELLARQEADAARTAKKQRELDDLRAEAGPPSTAGGSDGFGRRVMERIAHVRPTMWATRMAHEGISSDVGPALEEALGFLPEDSPAWAPLQGALSAITGVFGVLDAAVNGKEDADQFDMAVEDSEGAETWPEDSLDAVSLPEAEGTADGRGAAGGGDGDFAKRRAVAGPGGGVARWTRSRDGGEGAWTRSRAETARAGSTARSGAATSHDSGTGHQAPTGAAAVTPPAGGAAAAAAAEMQRNIEDAGRRRAAAEAEERRRLEQAMSPQERAQAETLHAQQAAAASVGFGTAQALELAQRVHSDRLNEVLKAARERDEPADLAEMRAMSAEGLEDFARRHV